MKLSDTIKLELMKFLRFRKQYDCVCSEGVNNADISAIKNQKLIEIEIKISKSDFKNELKHKAWKHDKYKDKQALKNTDWMRIPNKFFFCVPQEMEEWALKEMENINLKYGLIVWQEGLVYIRRQAMHLHNDKLNNFVLVEFSKRITSELINLKIQAYENKQELEALKKGVLVAEGVRI